jgi:hypothetical protein
MQGRYITIPINPYKQCGANLQGVVSNVHTPYVHAKHEIDQSQVFPLKSSHKIHSKSWRAAWRGQYIWEICRVDCSYPEKRAVFDYFSSGFPGVSVFSGLHSGCIEDALTKVPEQGWKEDRANLDGDAFWEAVKFQTEQGPWGWRGVRPLWHIASHHNNGCSGRISLLWVQQTLPVHNFKDKALALIFLSKITESEQLSCKPASLQTRDISTACVPSTITLGSLKHV